MVLKWFLIGCCVACVVQGYAATLQKEKKKLYCESFHLAFSPVKRSDCGIFKVRSFGYYRGLKCGLCGS